MIYEIYEINGVICTIGDAFADGTNENPHFTAPIIAEDGRTGRVFFDTVDWENEDIRACADWGNPERVDIDGEQFPGRRATYGGIIVDTVKHVGHWCGPATIWDRAASGLDEATLNTIFSASEETQ